MNTPPNNRDPLDALLASQPVRPSADFTQRVLERLDREGDFDSELDERLANQPLRPGAEYTDTVMKAIEAESDYKVLGFPSWVVALGSIAALMVAGVLAFVALFNKGAHDAQGDFAKSPSQTAEVAMVDADVSVGTVSVEAQVSPSTALADMSDWEQLLIMQEALSDISALNEQQDWQTVAMLVD